MSQHSYARLPALVKAAAERKPHMKAWIRKGYDSTTVFVDERQGGFNYGHVDVYPDAHGGGVLHVYGPYASNIRSALEDAGLHEGRGAAARATRSRSHFRKPSHRDLSLEKVVDVRSRSSGGWDVVFQGDRSVRVHQGHGRSDLWYAMRPTDLRHEGRSDSPQRRRVMQFLALASVMPGRITGPAEFFVDRDGDVYAEAM
jgi:hypothetical protein